MCAKSNLRAFLGVAGGREARAVCCQTGGIVCDSARLTSCTGLTHIGMSGSRLYNQCVRRALCLQPPPCSPSARIAVIASSPPRAGATTSHKHSFSDGRHDGRRSYGQTESQGLRRFPVLGNDRVGVVGSRRLLWLTARRALWSSSQPGPGNAFADRRSGGNRCSWIYSSIAGM